MNPASQFVNAIQNVGKVATPTSYIPEVANFFGGKVRAARAGAAGAGLGGWASQTVQDDEARRRQRLQQLQDQLDPSKYQQLRKDDGGFAFLDPNGKEIDIDTFAKRTGQRRADVLKDSENPIDQQYISDWSKMNNIMQAVYNNDQITLQGVKDAMGIGDVKPEDLAKRLMEWYPHMYGRGKYKDTIKNWGKPLFNFDPSDPTTWGARGGGGGGFQL